MELILEAPGKLYAALAKAQQSFKPIPRNREVEVTTKAGQKYKFRYATLDAVIDATREALASNGLAQVCIIGNGKITVTLAHESGESVSSSLPLPDPAGGWQAFGSALTYARRYLWSPMIGVAAEEDDDGNAADGNSIADPLQKLWDALEAAGIMAKGKEAVRAWCELVLGRPIPTSDALKETDVPLLIGTAQGKLPLPKAKEEPKPAEAKPATVSPLAKTLNDALDKIAPWGELPMERLDKAGVASAKKAAKLAWINGMLASGLPPIKALGELPETELQRLTAAAQNGEMPDQDAEPTWMDK